MAKKNLEEVSKQIGVALEVFDPYLNLEEKANAKLLLQKDSLKISDVEEYFESERAKDMADILFLNRDKFSRYAETIAQDFFVVCERYYNSKLSLNLIFGEGALEPEGMLMAPDSKGKWNYESFY